MISQKDISIISKQLGRYPRGAYKISYRCECKLPVVIKVKSKLDNGTPFPTTFYLVDSYLIKEISKLESIGFMNELNNLLKTSLKFSKQYKKAHKEYISHRKFNPPELKNISVGGMPNHIKCLHVHIAHSLSVRPNINPVGDILLKKLDITNKCFH
jgi:hypothetical protein